VASPLENLSGPGGPLQKEAPDAKEFAGLRRSALARHSSVDAVMDEIDANMRAHSGSNRHPPTTQQFPRSLRCA
jgi:hypothetical protein